MHPVCCPAAAPCEAMPMGCLVLAFAVAVVGGDIGFQSKIWHVLFGYWRPAGRVLTRRRYVLTS